MRNQAWLGRLVRSERRVKNLRVGAQDLFELVEPLLELTTIAGAQTRLLALLVLAVSAVTAAPATRGLTTVALDLQSIVLVSAAWHARTFPRVIHSMIAMAERGNMKMLVYV